MRYLVEILILILLAMIGLSSMVKADGAGIATIDGVPVSYEEFERLVYTEARQTFYHAATPDDETYLAFRRGVADKLVDRGG